MSFGGSYNPVLDTQPRDGPLDASQVLAAALEQMDDIIAATTHECSLDSTGNDFSILKSNDISSNITFSPKTPESSTPPLNSVLCINQILNNLKEIIETKNDLNGKSFPTDLNISSATAVYSWLQKVLKDSTEDPKIPVSDDISGLQKVHELESDKKNLILQASVLADQVDAQAHKIQELERHLDRKKAEFMRLEQSIHQEVLARSTIENSKLELMTELSNLRLRLTAAERDRKESDDKCRKLEHEFVSLRACMIEYQTELAILKSKLSRNGTQVNSGSEVDKLKSTLESGNLSIDDKDQKVENLKSSLIRYKKLQDVLSNCNSKNVAENSTGEYSINDMDSILNTLNDVSNSSSVENKLTTQSVKLAANNQSSITATSLGSSSSSPVSSAFHKSSSVENLCPTSVTLPNSQYGTMPRNTGSQVLQQLQIRLKQHEDEVDYSPKSIYSEKKESSKKEDVKETSKNNKTLPGTKSAGVSFGKGFLKLISGKRSTSELNLAAQECITIPSTEKENAEYISPVTQPYLIKPDKDKNRGFLKFFSKWKKTGSQNIDSLEGDFKRGGVRATAGPRLGWSKDLIQDTDMPFTCWNTDLIVEWLHRLGLSAYVNECKRWMCNGEMLAKASVADLEKELGIKNPLHRKKLNLAIKSMTNGLTNLPASINAMDYHWVVRWLDDVGLPQYKDSFCEARVDGRVLHYLTVDELLFLKVTSQLHHISIRRGIQLLREKGFDPHCLIRRSLPDESKTYTPELVSLWSNHRVMEWLRTVDLSEYAPNLRGSGVHGAFIVYEPKFNTNLFATLLNIPPTKTLLRRHLATHFKHIVGEELSQLKREEETEVPLSPSIKVKVVRKNQFALKKKRNKGESENEDYVCPMDIPVANEAVKSSESEKLVVRRNSDPSPQDPRHLELQNLLQDNNLNEAPTTIV